MRLGRVHRTLGVNLFDIINNKKSCTHFFNGSRDLSDAKILLSSLSEAKWLIKQRLLKSACVKTTEFKYFAASFQRLSRNETVELRCSKDRLYIHVRQLSIGITLDVNSRQLSIFQNLPWFFGKSVVLRPLLWLHGVSPRKSVMCTYVFLTLLF